MTRYLQLCLDKGSEDSGHIVLGAIQGNHCHLGHGVVASLSTSFALLVAVLRLSPALYKRNTHPVKNFVGLNITPPLVCKGSKF